MKSITFSVVKEIVAEYIKYEFGVFDEHGYSDSLIYPDFIKRKSNIMPNSCTNQPIRGNFSQRCIDEDACVIENGQSQITSSLLYSQNEQLFPQVVNYQILK